MPTINQMAAELTHAFASGDAVHGNALLARIMAMQDRRSPQTAGNRGNFAFYPEHSEPTDLNALSFCGPSLGYVAMEHDRHLTDDNRRALWDQVLPECLVGYDNHYRHKSGGGPGAPKPRWWQCNIWFLNMAGRLMIARALEHAEHLATAREHLALARQYVQLYGVAEYNSPTYLVPQLEALHWAWHYAPDADARQDATLLLDELYLDMAEHYHPTSGTLAGTWSRHYEWDVAGRGQVAPFLDAAFERRQPSFLEALGLEDYQCPPAVREVAMTEQAYSVWRRNLAEVERTTYQTPEYSLATQSGSFIWKQQDTPVRLTYVAPDGGRQTALVRTPYWTSDVHAASDYAAGFERWAHQHEHRAILSYGQTAGGNDLLFNLATLDELTPDLADGEGQPLAAPACPMMPAPPSTNPDRPASPHFNNKAANLTYADPATRPPPGLAVSGPVLVGFPSCYLAIVPEAGLNLHIAAMQGDLVVAIPVRPTAMLALIMVGRSGCKTMIQFAEQVSQINLDQITLPNVANAARLQGLGPTLTAGRDADGRLFDRRVGDVWPEHQAYWCYSPFYTRRSGETLSRAAQGTPKSTSTPE
ncbi:hypothetical protein ACERK3_01600 [Phycisphaerales bacterium AB-hyl4]|uniref:Heparin-sulfate lyase N-terminal domain-containing protein n=1 Tax=Natronomicrosphaera hydrolytica TaxID=3242702 RepID=A0ABV4U3U9_9BACT